LLTKIYALLSILELTGQDVEFYSKHFTNLSARVDEPTTTKNIFVEIFVYM
jgi:hypothetical protein